jgi:hypothetical protein
MATLLINSRVSELPDDGPVGGPWAPVARLPELTGWELKPEGACLGELCVPLPRGREAEFQRDGWFNIGALAEYLSQPVAHDTETGTWSVGESARDRGASLDSLEAPDFSLPDFRGVDHQLHDYRGKKIFLVSWASW